MVIGGFVCLVGVIVVMKWGVLDFWVVVFIELFFEFLLFVVMLMGWYFKCLVDV